MMGATLVLMLQSVMLSPSANDFAHAYQVATTQNVPLLVLVGAEWCPSCQTMKKRTIPQLQRTGKLDHLAYAYVDTDRQRQLARKIMRGGAVPQLILFVPDRSGWRRFQVTGAVPAEQIESLIGRATQRPGAARRARLPRLEPVR